MIIEKGIKLMLFSALTILLSAPAIASDEHKVKEERERAQDASAVFTEIMNAPDSGIPKELLEDATAVAVIPHVVKGAFIVGGKYGHGLVSQRMSNGEWSAPAYVTLEGGSVGFQIGASATDYVLIFTNRKGLEPLLKGKVKLGGDASVAAGPVGRTAEAGTDVTLHSAIYSYSRSKGAFAGVALDGAVISIDDSANRDVYGRNLTGEQILLGKDVAANSVTRPFVNTLDKYAR